ncbi:sensor histidine kinase [Saccharicrinis aurantiacus]|uniref:sensor histidine kinase n=1 Tax=Saccharicrinis aurantiacus TaxID=1849719 RepID=UPI0008394E57|nr:PAS domain-containing hybrid sensor histidine kinase/response regulator [Saccharicrinis aurantiacus]
MGRYNKPYSNNDFNTLSDAEKSALINEYIEKESRYKALSEATFEGIFITQNGYCVDANHSGCDMLGYKLDEIIGMYAIDVILPEYKELAYNMMISGSEEPYNVAVVRKDDSSFIAEVRGKNYLLNENTKSRVVILRDITEQLKVAEKLKASEKKYRSVVEHAGDGILIGNLKGEIIDVNHGFLNMVGYQKDEIINQHISKIFDKETLTNSPLQFDTLDKGGTIILERYIISKNGERIPIEMNSTKPDQSYYLTIIRDLRERNKVKNDLLRTNEELILAKEKAEESDRLKSAFLANMSHEIRTPMNGIIGFTELLKNPTINPSTRQEYLNLILNNGQQLLGIINDLLEISKIETGQVILENGPFNIHELFNELRNFFNSIALLNQNKIIFTLDELSSSTYNGDKYKIQQVLTNLINNALKFTKEGTVEVIAKSSNDSVLFAVKDSGIGIHPNDIEHIFNRFTQISNSDLKKEKGTGLGLSICKNLVHMMNGEIWVESELNIGSKFYFELPLKQID